MAQPLRIFVLVLIASWGSALVQILIAVVNPFTRGLPSRYVRAARVMGAANMVVLASGATVGELNIAGTLPDSLFIPVILALGALWIASWTALTILIGIQTPELAARLHMARVYAWLHSDGPHPRQNASETSNRAASGDRT